MTISRRDLLWAAEPARAEPRRRPDGRPAPRIRQASMPSIQAGVRAPRLRVLRWAPFVKGEEDSWLANTKEVHRR